MPIDRDQILAASFDVLRESGLDKLSLRAIARRLEIQAPALYWYFDSRSALISAMAQQFYSQAAGAAAGKHHEAYLMAYAYEFRRSLLGCRDAAALIASATPAETPEAAAMRLTAGLGEASGEREQHLMQLGAVIAYTLGWAIYMQSEHMFTHLSQIYDLDRAFDQGLRALVSGLRVAPVGSEPRRPSAP